MNIFVNVSSSNNILEIYEQEISFILNFTSSATARVSTFNPDISLVHISLGIEKHRLASIEYGGLWLDFNPMTPIRLKPPVRQKPDSGSFGRLGEFFRKNVVPFFVDN
ncbi:hypothetical protein AVEN_196710-1 [Araneus ventricosus]|uniref:Uncharacterized protein n=1 Tax=Araneus ventricosus TaxID=182803 RepID=A0A4Y2GYG3_ARAVE|nr:hypothetical protein AVEN_196710-1 [Araneus ventricosus]